MGETLRKNIARKGLFRRIELHQSLKELEPEINLGRYILDRALLDALEHLESRLWFSIEDEEFHDICFISALEPEFVLEKFHLIIKKLETHE